MGAKKTEQGPVVVRISLQLRGANAERFLRFKTKEHIEADAVVAHKLIAERLEQIYQPAASGP